MFLFQQFRQSFSTAERLLRRGVKIGTKLSKGGDFTVLSQKELEGTGNLLHRFDLSSGTDARHGETDVDSRADTFVEKFGFQENLAVGNGDNVSGDIGGDITTLGLDDGQGGQRTTPVGFIEFGGPL